MLAVKAQAQKGSPGNMEPRVLERMKVLSIPIRVNLKKCITQHKVDMDQYANSCSFEGKVQHYSLPSQAP